MNALVRYLLGGVWVMVASSVIATESAELLIVAKLKPIPCSIDITGQMDFGKLDMDKIIEAKKNQTMAQFSDLSGARPSVVISCSAPIYLGIRAVPNISIGELYGGLPDGLESPRVS